MDGRFFKIYYVFRWDLQWFVISIKTFIMENEIYILKQLLIVRNYFHLFHENGGGKKEIIKLTIFFIAVRIVNIAK